MQKSGDKVFDDLIMKLLNKYKERRISYEQYFKHPFFRFNEPKNVLAFNKIYNTNISSYDKRIYFSGYFNGNQLLKDLSKVSFVNLKELHLEFCNITDLTPLESESFKNILLLNLQNNKISNLNPLKKIKFIWVKEITFNFNNIIDISPLKEIPFKQLERICFLGNPSFINNERNKSIIHSIISKKI